MSKCKIFWHPLYATVIDCKMFWHFLYGTVIDFQKSNYGRGGLTVIYQLISIVHEEATMTTQNNWDTQLSIKA